MTPPKAKDRYLPRHQWYLADALLVIRQLQATLWPLGWHVTLGGSVLNHGYSNSDLDLYVLPIYRKEEPPDAAIALQAVSVVLGEPVTDLTGSIPPGAPEHECYVFANVYAVSQGRIDVFIVKPFLNNATN